MDTKVKFICCDMPDANELTINIFGALAQWERKRISERTTEALKQLKKKGVKLGTPGNFTVEVRKQGPLKIKENAISNPNNQKAKKLIGLLNKEGKTLRKIAEELNESGFKTSRGGSFRPEQVRRLIVKDLTKKNENF
jgi:DNA invertase Pin-like site-specific DNA recombinase